MPRMTATVAACPTAEERTLNAQQEHTLNIVDSAPCLLYSYKINHATGASSFPFCSEHCHELLGVSAGSVMEDPAAMVNLVHPDDIPVFTNAVVKSMSDLSLFDQTLRLKHAKTGVYMDLLDRSQPYRDQERNSETGELDTVTVWKGFIIQKPPECCNVVDKLLIPKEEDNEEDLLLMESPLIPFFALDSTNGTITKWNNVLAEATGFASSDVVGKQACSLFRWNEEDTTTFTDKLLETPKWSVSLTGKTGNEVHLVLSGTKSSKHPHNTAIHVLCQDVTQLKQVIQERNKATRLAESERSLTEWLSHEIRNPLSVVMEAAQTLEDSHQECDNNRKLGGSYLQLIKHSITYVVDILTNMLDLNKLAEGKIVLRPETCRIRTDVLQPTQQIMGLCGKIPIVLEGANTCLQVDKLRLKQVFANLISNSLKYTSQGVITIKVHPLKSDDSFLTITVSDSGIGIQPSQYQHLFSRFEQLGSSVNGAGIGLCLCKNLLMHMGGDIFLNKDYQSKVPGFPGAQFVVRLPCAHKAPPTPAFDALSAALISTAMSVDQKSAGKKTTNNTATKPPTTNSTPLPTITISPKASIRGKYRILVVDDELVGQKLLVRRFQRIFPQARIDSSPSGEQAVRMATTQSNAYDLITMDHYMKVGEMTGEETILELRQQNVDALIVGISGNAMREQHLKAGADGFFQKPLPATDVVVRSLVDKLPPPASWRVLLVDDAEVNLQLLERKLQQLAKPHHHTAAKGGASASARWEIIKCTLASRAKTLLQEQSFDLVVLDQHLEQQPQGEAASGIELGEFGRAHQDEDTVFVLNSGSSVEDLPAWFNLAWSKPLPSVGEMRRDLFRALMNSPPATSPSA